MLKIGWGYQSEIAFVVHPSILIFLLTLLCHQRFGSSLYTMQSLELLRNQKNIEREKKISRFTFRDFMAIPKIDTNTTGIIGKLVVFTSIVDARLIPVAIANGFDRNSNT